MIVLLEDAEAWSLMMVTSAIAIDNAEISVDATEAIRLWRSEHQDESEYCGEKWGKDHLVRTSPGVPR